MALHKLLDLTYPVSGSSQKQEIMSIKHCCGLGRCVVTKGLQDCASCKSISYCGKEHQTEHFKDGHKLVCPGKAKPLPFAACVEGATQYYNAKMWAAALPYYSALLVSECTVELVAPTLTCDVCQNVIIKQKLTFKICHAQCFSNDISLQELIERGYGKLSSIKLFPDFYKASSITLRPT